MTQQLLLTDMQEYLHVAGEGAREKCFSMAERAEHTRL